MIAINTFAKPIFDDLSHIHPCAEWVGQVAAVSIQHGFEESVKVEKLVGDPLSHAKQIATSGIPFALKNRVPQKPQGLIRIIDMATTVIPRSDVESFALTNASASLTNRCSRIRSDAASEFRSRLENHPHFRGRSKWVQARARGGVLRLSGCLPSFYLKQLVQAVARNVPNIQRVVNRICVRDTCGVIPSQSVIRETGRSLRRPR